MIIGACVKKTDKEGLTALSWACHQGHRHAVMTLLDKGSNINAIDKNGRTPLDLAATCSDPKIVQVKLINSSFVSESLRGLFITFSIDIVRERCYLGTR